MADQGFLRSVSLQEPGAPDGCQAGAPGLSILHCSSVDPFQSQGLMVGSRRFKVALVSAAERAAPVIRKILECRAGVDAVAGVAFSRVIDVVADYTAELGHDSLLEWYGPLTGGPDK